MAQKREVGGVCVWQRQGLAGRERDKKREGEGESDSGDSLRMRLSQFIEELGISCERKKWDRTSRLLS